ncbi:serine hydrolase [Limosilactobacillus gastricus]|uniref:Putative esterase n=1 Tax=Limosilactobacillus gastricus DSM 16045 TaxID=1423749 RepID=A0A0R1VD61_9LACO|nr:serine hydrolase domain-containing protein [Limosilactobacillus gastricus]KRM03418.1 putative esterase [Limosilactobacillus gastricus DSM 16045]QGF40874.1 serine hydrolase [Limosilactobacillus gastricus]
MYQKTQVSLKTMVDQGIVPALAMAIIDPRGDHQAFFGTTDGKANHSVNAKHFFDLASLTKVLGTLPVVLNLLGQHALSLNDPVNKYLPIVQDSRLTIRHLLTHTSVMDGYIPHRNQLTAPELKTALLSTQMSGDNLGRLIRYSDTNYLYLGWIVESILGQPIQTVIEQRLIQPLEIAGLTFHPDSQLAVPTADLAGERFQGIVHDPKARILKNQCGSAGLFGTLDGVQQLLSLWLANNLKEIIEPSLTSMMQTDQTAMPGHHLRGLGWKLMHATAPDHHFVVTHTGFTGTWVMVDFKQNQALIVLSNRVYPNGQNDQFLDLRDQVMATYLGEKEEN